MFRAISCTSSAVSPWSRRMPAKVCTLRRRAQVVGEEGGEVLLLLQELIQFGQRELYVLH